MSTHIIAGVVTDNYNKPVENATVIIRNKTISNFDLTDENGRFDFSGLSYGDYELLILHRNHNTVREIISVNADISIEVQTLRTVA